MNDELFDWIVPVSYSPGHMGTFLQGFLTPKLDFLFYNNIIKDTNHEWIFRDLFDGFFGLNPKTYNDLIYILLDFYTAPEIFKIAAVVILNTKFYLKYYLNDQICFTMDHIPLVLDLAKDKKYHQLQFPIELVKTRTSRYIKEHRSSIGFKKITLSISDTPWVRKRITCDFSNEKLWIPYYLLKYKSSKSTYLSYNIELFHNDTNEFFITRSNMFEDVKFNISNLQVDMYDLIFNKNIDQVYKIDPNFEFTKEKEEMLNLAKSSSIEILESFGIDHNTSINNNTTIQEVLDMQTKHQTLMQRQKGHCHF